MKRQHILTISLLTALIAPLASAQDFQYAPPGELVSGSGRGRSDEQVYVPGMRFPIEAAPAWANSQVWGRGGSMGGGGGQCDAQNYSYPWRDNYCESRQWDMPLCPSGTGHQGQDIRPSTCENRRWWAVAAESGTITSIGSYSVTLMADGGTRHRYLHMDPDSVEVRQGQRVARGDRLGLVSNAFGGTPTTIHLHYDIVQDVQGAGSVYVPTYLSLVRSYEELIGEEAQPCAELPARGGVLDNSGPCFARFGPPTTWRHVTTEGQEGDLYWTYAWDNETPGNWARWNLHLVEAGTYEVAVNVLPEWAASRRAPYRVRHAGEETALAINQSLGPGWISLGEFDFAAGGDQWVSVSDNSGEASEDQLRIMADAVMLTRVGMEQPDLGAPDEGVEDITPADVAPEDLPEEDTGAPDEGLPDLPAAEDQGAPDAADEGAPDSADPPRDEDQGAEPDALEPDLGQGGPVQARTQTRAEGCATAPGAPNAPSPLWLALGLLGLLARRR